jgi:hypothetical protein
VWGLELRTLFSYNLWPYVSTCGYRGWI